MSAVLGILSSATVFCPDIQKLAKKVKNDVRNLWGHCNFTEWSDAKFSSCCQLMKSLVEALKLPKDGERRIIDELGEWETKGTLFCNGRKILILKQIQELLYLFLEITLPPVIISTCPLSCFLLISYPSILSFSLLFQISCLLNLCIFRCWCRFGCRVYRVCKSRNGTVV